MAKVAIDLVGGKLTDSKYSHKNAWAHLRACQLAERLGEEVVVLHDGEDWGDYKGIFLYHGMEFKDTLNLFGGATEESAKFFERMAYAPVNTTFMSLDIPMPDYGELCRGRLKSCDPYWANVEWDKVSIFCKEQVGHFRHPQVTDSLVMGDSHSFSVYQKGYMTVRKDGRTLKGVLKKTIQKEMSDNGINPTTIKNFTGYWGNIDVRHHLMRTPRPKEEIQILLTEYEAQLKGLKCNIELVHLLPVEDESRRIPQTGFFEGTAFYGSQRDRAVLVQYFNDELDKIAKKNGWKVFTWDDDWYRMSPLQYMKTYMERPKNVHLAPMYHRWNYWENKENKVEKQVTLDNFF